MAVNSILIDSNGYSAFKRRAADALDIVQNCDRIGVSVVVLGELLHGFQLASRERQNRSDLEEFLRSPLVEIVPVGESVAERYATLKTQLRRLGKPIPINDLWIAATAVELGFAVFTLDAHFRHVPGLKVVMKMTDLGAI